MGLRKRKSEKPVIEKMGETPIERLGQMIRAGVCRDEVVNNALVQFVDQASQAPTSSAITEAVALVEQAVTQFIQPNKTAAEKKALNKLLDEIQHKAIQLDDPKNLIKRKVSVALFAVGVALTLAACALMMVFGMSLGAGAILPFSIAVAALTPITAIAGLAIEGLGDFLAEVTYRPKPLAASLLLFRDNAKDTLNGRNPSNPTFAAHVFRPLRVH